jgi:hypothetical protein
LPDVRDFLPDVVFKNARRGNSSAALIFKKESEIIMTEKEKLERNAKVESILNKVIDKIGAMKIEEMEIAEISALLSLLGMCRYYSPFFYCVDTSLIKKDGESNA